VFTALLEQSVNVVGFIPKASTRSLRSYIIRPDDRFLNYDTLRIAEQFIDRYTTFWGYVVAQFVEALRYRPEGYGFDSR
jgi:hypothetical protein